MFHTCATIVKNAKLISIMKIAYRLPIHNTLVMKPCIKFILLVTIYSFVKGGVVDLPESKRTTLNAALDYYKSYANGYNQKFTILTDEYDFIIVGSGPGGSVVANRLSEIRKWKVLLLEAGEQESIFSEIPGQFTILRLTNYNWRFNAEQQPGFCLGLKDKQCAVPRGKALGGTSTINDMLYFRGHNMDYNGWAALGNKGWNYESVLPYFIKTENVADLKLRKKWYRGTEGPLGVRQTRTKTKILQSFFDAAEELGFPINDYNDGNIGDQFSRAQCMIDGAVRSSAAKAYLKPAKDRNNLYISAETFVIKVLIDESTKTAYGVRVYKDGKFFNIRARKEVILSAGTIQTPQLLMVSGIGPKDHLIEMDINVINDLPGVGENLQDHPAFPMLTFSVNQTGVVATPDSTATVQYFFGGIGPYAEPLVDAFGFIRTKYNHPILDPRPDIEFLFESSSIVTDKGNLGRRVFGVTDETYNTVFKPFENEQTFSIMPMLLKARSRGSIKLNSSSMFDAPKIYTNYFDDERDLNTLVEGVKFAIKMTESGAFQKYDTHVNVLDIRDCRIHTPKSDEYWKCAIRQYASPFHHFTGTSKMGPKEDVMSVVSSNLKVHGIENLRVIDASIMPFEPIAHTAVPTYMIGEKGSDLIKLEWGELL